MAPSTVSFQGSCLHRLVGFPDCYLFLFHCMAFLWKIKKRDCSRPRVQSRLCSQWRNSWHLASAGAFSPDKSFPFSLDKWDVQGSHQVEGGAEQPLTALLLRQLLQEAEPAAGGAAAAGQAAAEPAGGERGCFRGWLGGGGGGQVGARRRLPSLRGSCFSEQLAEDL